MHRDTQYDLHLEAKGQVRLSMLVVRLRGLDLWIFGEAVQLFTLQRANAITHYGMGAFHKYIFKTGTQSFVDPLTFSFQT